MKQKDDAGYGRSRLADRERLSQAIPSGIKDGGDLGL